MFGLFAKDTPSVGSVLFPGNIPPRPEEFAIPLEKAGVVAEPRKAGDGAHWSLRLRHPRWGEAELVSLKASVVPPSTLIEHCSNLDPQEQAAALRAGRGVTMRVKSTQKHVLRDRKHLLRFMHTVMDGDGVAAVDHTSQLFWSPERLDEELAHDAELDIQGVYCIHAVTDDEADDESDGPRVKWLHTHGLAELGAFDYDILRPSADLMGRGQDTLRALAFAIVEGHLKPTTPSWVLAEPRGTIRMVPASEFQRSAPEEDRALRTQEDGHAENRAVVCEPVGGLKGLFSKGVRPSRFCSSEVGEQVMVSFSNAATELMARRARGTLAALERAMEEFAEFQFPTLAKIGYPTDGRGAGGGEADAEHMWFSVHGIRAGRIDGTLENQPFRIARMKQGQRGEHPVDQLTDWTMMTPVGHITPRDMAAVRILRANRDNLRAMMKEMGSDED